LRKRFFILPVVDVLARNNNPTGTIKAGVCARGHAGPRAAVEVGVPRRPGQGVGPADRTYLAGLIADITRAEQQTAAELAAR
jgi:hypothetical protein